MDLTAKGSVAAVGTIKKLLVKLTWSLAADFDLAALVQKDDNTFTMIYFNKLGDLNSYPYIQLDKDSGVGDTVSGGGENEENLTIEKLEGSKKVHLICWDYGAIQKGAPARFKDSDVKIRVIGDKGNDHKVHLDAGNLGNICCIGTIKNGPTGAELVNTSTAGIMKEFTNTTDIIKTLNLN